MRNEDYQQPRQDKDLEKECRESNVTPDWMKKAFMSYERCIRIGGLSCGIDLSNSSVLQHRGKINPEQDSTKI